MDVQFRWKEEVILWDGRQGFVFDGAWGGRFPITIVPDEATWDGAVPEWLHGRRKTVLDRLREEPNHLVQSEDASHWGDPCEREVTREV
ncbi:MAG: hypothetical protein ACE37B_06930 [Ilumatobacter sp.]|uniref:hypothetical protein n=1 Tax=Ilumatobacter sp. TaxID=1967498 RepID=UPI00391CABD0